ncbi:Outer envelope pore protein 37, chloroplastic [Zostera marina]|uniref:Outer envelope pore protein 37, chloroplastic n=1 Tax=Zostera marina TaxID=29655 RepID=A0A0K9PQ50_ZOSMR|nr:Outer envelope pore protein 37, chloroplastic [Zostera marina]
MGNSTATQNPKSIFVQLPPSQPPLQAPNTTDTDPIGRLFNRPSFRVTSEFDSDSNLFLHKISYKFLENLAKLKLSFQNDCSGELSSPQLGLLSKYFSILYDFDSQNALVQGSFDVGGRLQFSASHDTDAKQRDISMIACLADPSYKLELSSSLPPIGMPKATIHFPFGNISLKKSDEETMIPFVYLMGIFKNETMTNSASIKVGDGDATLLRLSYKDKEMTFTPKLCLSSNGPSFAFKRRFTPMTKLSYCYNFNSGIWSAVYKHTVGKDLKFKTGYDSEVRLGWASFWVGDESGNLKSAPMKMKVQVMLQVPKGDPNNSLVMFRVKKRWDF